MGSEPEKTRPKALPRDQVRFGLLLAVVASCLIAGILLTRPKPLTLGGQLRPIMKSLDARQRRHQAQLVRSLCKHHDCACVEAAAHAGLDVDAGREVLGLLTAARTCSFPDLAGVRAEALVRAGHSEEGRSQAGAVLKKNDKDGHALSAIGLRAYQEGTWPAAAELLERAVKAGAGDGARELLGLARYNLNDLAGARAAFQGILTSEPQDLDATYNLALVAQKQDRYGEARKLYLTVLRANPKQRQARYNLALLAHSIGAQEEAQHNLALLEQTAPEDPLVQRLREALARPPDRKGQVLTLGSKAAAPPR
jgi:tetratricopeptide (TPR) repeat protein